MEADFLSVCSHQNLTLFGRYACILIVICVTHRNNSLFPKSHKLLHLLSYQVGYQQLKCSLHNFYIFRSQVLYKYAETRKNILLWPIIQESLSRSALSVLDVKGNIRHHKLSQILKLFGNFSSHMSSCQRKKSRSKKWF